MAFCEPTTRGLCFNCGRAGHKACDCRGAGQFRAAGEQRVQRSQDNGRRHYGNQCNQEPQCFKCKNYGHLSRDCTAAAPRTAASATSYHQDDRRARSQESKRSEQRAPLNRSARIGTPPRSALKQEGGRRQWNKRVAFVEEQATNDSGPELGAAAATARGLTLKVMINGKIRANIDVDTMASRSCMTSGILDDMKLLTPIATQTLITAVTFTLGDNSEVSCTEIAYVDMAIHTHEDIINIKGVPVFI